MKNIQRRRFLSLSLAASGSLLLPTSCLSKKRNSNTLNKKPIGIALLGLGSYSTYQLAPALQMTKNCHLAGIITGSPDKIPTWKKKYAIPDANIYNYENMDQIANNEAIDVIYIVTPTGTHAKFAIAAANAGKHVWCEKPMAMNTKDCQAIIDACQQNKVQLTIGYRMQHEPNTLTLNSYASSKPFGEMTQIDSQAGYAGGGGSGWRFQKDLGGGALYDMGVYTVNGARNAAQMYPKRVLSARQYTDRPNLFKEVDETTEYVLEFETGLKAFGQTSVGKSYNLLKVTCEKGSYELSPMQTYDGVQGKRSDGILLNQMIKNQQARQMDEDALALLENRTMVISGQEGLKDIRIIEAIIRSAATESVVEI
ncbi:MAG: Gfo/Idh/MocA family oxidoreductase [Saprospiraceae bacterium]